MDKDTQGKSNSTSGTPTATLRTTQLFPLGAVVATPGALDLLDRNGINATTYLIRHQYGDFGTICPDDVQENMTAIKYQLRVLSVYDVGTERLWILTEADRYTTTLLLPSEY